MKYKVSFLLFALTVIFVTNCFAFDLKWRSPIEITPSVLTAGDTVTFKCKLKSGGGPSDNVKVVGKINGSKIWEHIYTHFDTDHTEWVSFTWSAVAGSHNVEFEVDPDQTAGDGNYDNNTRSTSFSVAPGGGDSGDKPGGVLGVAKFPMKKIGIKTQLPRIPSADITIAELKIEKIALGTPQHKATKINSDGNFHVDSFFDVTYDPEKDGQKLFEGLKYRISCKWKRAGAVAKPFRVTIYVDEVAIGPLDGSLADNNKISDTVRVFWTARAGSHSFKCEADSNHDILETDESNNTLTISRLVQLVINIRK